MFGRSVVVRVLDDTLMHLEGQVETAKFRVAQLEVVNDAQSLEIVVKEFAVVLHGGIKCTLAGVTEGGMSDVVDERQGFGEIDVEVERGGDSAGDLCDLHGVGEARTKMVGVAAREDLRLVLQPAEGAGVNDAITVALEGIAVGVCRLGIATPARVFDADRVGGEHGESVTKISDRRLPVVSFKTAPTTDDTDKRPARQSRIGGLTQTTTSSRS